MILASVLMMSIPSSADNTCPVCGHERGRSIYTCDWCQLTDKVEKMGKEISELRDEVIELRGALRDHEYYRHSADDDEDEN